jgi:hypothetical protein
MPTKTGTIKVGLKSGHKFQDGTRHQDQLNAYLDSNHGALTCREVRPRDGPRTHAHCILLAPRSAARYGDYISSSNLEHHL